jgi:hypothetical protein
MKALTLEMAAQITLKSKGRCNVTGFVYCMEEINNIFFYETCFVNELSFISVYTVYFRLV